ncbi:MAG: hypothetical protein RJA76_940 [Bacteroidota bacterium]|jgi:hypothetical protein
MKKSILTLVILMTFGLGAMAQNLADFQGTFQLDDNPYVKQVKFNVKENKLFILAEGFPETELSVGKNADEFILANTDGGVSFTRENGKVVACKITAQGQELKGKILADALDKFAGTFKMMENEYVKKLSVLFSDGKLYLTSDGDESQKSLLSSTKDTNVFTTSVRGYEADVIFTNAGNAVKSIKLSVAGGVVVLTGEKEN